MSSAGVALSPVRDDPVGFNGSRSPHCLEDSIVIYLTVPGSPALPMRVLESDSVAAVKLRIQSCRGFVVSKQRLVLDGRELARNDCLVRDYGVADGNVLHLVIRLSDLRFITVETTCGKKLEFHVERSRSIGYVKEQIARRNGDFVDVGDQKLICDGEELDDQRVIDDICKNNDGAIHLLVRKTVQVRAKPVEKDFEISIVAPKREDELGVIAHGPPDWMQPVAINPKVKLSPVIKDMIHAACAGLQKGNQPVMSSEGTGGAYFMQDVTGQKYIGVFKPIDEEPMAENNPRGLPVSVDGEGMKRGTRVGEGALREVAAYILDHPIGGHRSFLSDEVGFAGVPPTVMVQCLNGGFNHSDSYGYQKDYKIGSLQMFVKNQGSCEDMGPRAFPVEEVHKIAVMDIRLANVDRHAGNILICKKGEEGRFVLVPIDHGYCLPETFEDCTFEWLYWPQAHEPFNSKTIEYIRSLDAEEDIALLKFHGWDMPLECARTLRISSMLLKKGVERGLTPYDIGSIMCRQTLRKESVIEDIVHEAMDDVLPGTSEAVFLEAVSEVMDRHLNKLFP